MSLTLISVWCILFRTTWCNPKVIVPFSVYFIALEIKLSSIIVTTSLSKNKDISSCSISRQKSISGFRFNSLYFSPISCTRAARLSRLTHNFLFWVSVFLNSSIWLIRFNNRMALWWITDIFCESFPDKELLFCISSNGPRINVKGVRNSCVILV